jgi:hypothetical protein
LSKSWQKVSKNSETVGGGGEGGEEEEGDLKLLDRPGTTLLHLVKIVSFDPF